MFRDVPRLELMAASPGAQELINGIRTSPSSAIRMDPAQKHHGRLVESGSPAGFEQFVAEAGELFTQGPPEVERLGALAAKYHTTLGWNEWVSELTKKYKLKLFG